MNCKEVNERVIELRKINCPYGDFCNNPWECRDCTELNKEYTEDLNVAEELLDGMIRFRDDEYTIRNLHDDVSGNRVFYIEVDTRYAWGCRATDEPLNRAICLLYIERETKLKDMVDSLIGGKANERDMD